MKRVDTMSRQRAKQNYAKAFGISLDEDSLLEDQFQHCLEFATDDTPGVPIYFTYPNKAARKVELMASDHGVTLLKASHRRKSKMEMPDFQSSAERDTFFREHAQYFTVVQKTGVGSYSRDECKTLAKAEALAQTKKTIGGGNYMIYAVIGEQSAFVKGV